MSERLPRSALPAARRRDDTPSLFGDEFRPAGASAYPPAAARPAGFTQSYAGERRDTQRGPGTDQDSLPSSLRSSAVPSASLRETRPPAPDRDALRPVVAELAAEVLAEADRRLADAMRRAVAELAAGRPETARAILEVAMAEWTAAA